MRNRARIVAIAGLLSSVTCVVLLHIVRSDLPPVAHRLSEYANGPYGWMMTLAFVALGCALVALGVALRVGSDTDRITWVISASAFLAGLGTIVSGVFRTGTSQADEVIHSRASALATVAVVALALAYSLRFARRRLGAPRDPVGTGLALAAAALAVLSPLLHATRWTGLNQRVLWTVLLAWLLWAAWHPPPGWDPPGLRG